MSIKMTVIGLGYLGATHAVAMAEIGHQVIGIEPDARKLEALRAGKLPFHEPGLDTALVKAIASGNLTFQSEHNEGSRSAQVHFLCVGTPQLPGSYAADTKYLHSAIEALAPFVSSDAVVAGKSTVPVGTAAELSSKLDKLSGHEVSLCWNPEFLREGTALQDSLTPDRIVIGVDAADQLSETVMRRVYQPILDSNTGAAPGAIPFLVMDVATSELVKVAANSFLATKISFINAMAEIAEASGADAVRLAEAIGFDNRIGSQFLRNGIGFGGGCLPKDIRAFMARASELGVGQAVDFLADVDAVNLRRRERVVALAKRQLGELDGKRILVLGASFKPDSDDLRDSPALDVALQLKGLGADVVVHDPIALNAVREQQPTLGTNDDLTSAFEGAELVILGTEWQDYKKLDPQSLSGLVLNKTIIDGRNALDYSAWQAQGWNVIALGRNLEHSE